MDDLKGNSSQVCLSNWALKQRKMPWIYGISLSWKIEHLFSFSLVWSILHSTQQNVALQTPHIYKITSFYSHDDCFVTENIKKELKLLLEAEKKKRKANNITSKRVLTFVLPQKTLKKSWNCYLKQKKRKEKPII